MNAPMRYVEVRAADGTIRHELRPVGSVPAPKGRKKRIAPDPIKSMPGNAAADQLRLFIERIERIDEELRGMRDDRKDVLAEAKATGFDAKTINTIVQLRALDPNSRQEAEALLETYKASLGIA